MNDTNLNHEANDRSHSTLENQPLILVLNDDPEFLSFYKEHLEKENGMVIFESDNQPKAAELFYQLYPDYVIINASLIADDGVHVLNGFVQLCQDNHVPILISLDKEDLKLRYACMALADDVIGSRVEPVELVTRVIRNLRKRNRILDQILIDPMTGIKNYNNLQQEVEHQLNDLKRSHEPFAMVYVQVDDLSIVQETYGYAIGHQLVKELGEFIQNSIRPADSLYRFHREGFVLVLPKTVKEDAMKLMYRLIERFAQLRFQTTAGEISGTFSARVLDFMDPLQTIEQCLTLMPFPKDQAVADRKAWVMDGMATFTSVTLRKLKVGIIDDDRLIREMLKHQLEDIADQDFEVEIRAYPDGEEFFNDPWHRQNERFLLIIDRIMPKMDGLEVLQKIRTQYDRRRYLCMMLTSRDSEEEISMAIQRGANDYMVKPFSIKELRARIRRLIRGAR
ncbi:two-component system cell cycle response regulator [Paenibacillus sp. V4I3]|uniref:response regulator n=1 Tax=Paenibacillus sp. V4I3 TaxID=3042305 RepID=UPI00278433D8|nr:response regulator [Paenibacillus sp. V4I3]MDQ0872435.1 two-component system cell cycle response regulator [Paenibacillus sp. V4I3]